MHAGMATGMKPRASVSVEYDMQNRYVLWTKRRERDGEALISSKR